MIEKNNRLISTQNNKNKEQRKIMDSNKKIDLSIQGNIAKEIQFDDFMKIDLRVGLITKADYVEGADKLLRLTIDIGTEIREILSGIKSSYEPKDLVGKLTVVVANLSPRKMRFGVSEGMILASGDDNEVYLVSPESGAKPGQRIT
jgi:methionyl-tRNA synthetase